MKKILGWFKKKVMDKRYKDMRRDGLKVDDYTKFRNNVHFEAKLLIGMTAFCIVIVLIWLISLIV
tara:strand:+ start:2331 stop:2525 length:195 start_codon:yes stop_codon:yes gene_type:complete